MNQFEYLMVLVSIIVGLGIATLLRGTTRLIRARGLRGLYWVHVVWIAHVLSWHVGLWTFRWELRARSVWTFGDTLAFLLLPIGLFVLADACFPDSEAAVPEDLEAFFFRNRPLFFGAGAMVHVFSASTFVLLYDPAWRAPEVVLGLCSAVLALVLMRSERERLHQVVSVLALLVILFYFSAYRIQS